ncbi:RagB/SusD family nutrient uptake outer membrane protein [Aquimarina sp. AD10]|uniref:RagB/SusD family nutrient uptake outer membrane protein n=1 Tax=Aquimarina TaxID=290174 RepID=UPI000E4C03EB|nr:MULTISPECIES: RagB/SusD family nutrient uptake outer membrane protein [Aquimarina]AXT63558.1 RagB/SusD family nutrient uptake outer membrane protein [Aquimarina sp. AD10]RKM99814.1 RagB/SusD family nutrient uptake outer membrane protein [Aquimarina sp. AD10]
MKRIKIYSLFCLTVLLWSCDLDTVPTSAVVIDNFFNNDEEITAGIINIYDGLQGSNPLEGDGGFNNPHLAIQIEYQMAETLSDNSRTKSGSPQGFDFETFTVTPQTAAVITYYRSMYNIIFRANLVLENLQNASSENANKFEAEARFLRAYAYFNLVRFYGDVPLVDRVIGPEETEIAFTRVNETEVYELIVGDLQFAVASDLDNNSRTRVSKAAAQTFLAKVYLTQGTNYLDAQRLLETVIASGDYSLESDFSDIFYNEANNETIFAIGFGNDIVNDSQGFSAEFLDAVGRGTGSNYATAELVAAFASFGGNRGQFTFREDPGNPGLFQTVKFLPIVDENLGLPTNPPSNPRIAGNDWIVTRYADVLLLHVEAILAGGLETSAPAAIASFQAVRERAGITDPITSITKQELMDERRVELAFENHRFLDLKRFGVAQEVLSAFSTSNNFEFQATDLLLPIPGAEIAISQGLLKQNPGY